MARDGDAVPTLPGYGAPPSTQYSGFLDASASTPGTALHYWFAAKRDGDWMRAPTLLWMNGGPGSSSILGFLQEQGPLLVNASGGLMENPFADFVIGCFIGDGTLHGVAFNLARGAAKVFAFIVLIAFPTGGGALALRFFKTACKARCGFHHEIG